VWLLGLELDLAETSSLSAYGSCGRSNRGSSPLNTQMIPKRSCTGNRNRQADFGGGSPMPVFTQ
jgi:hypothetical protein